MKIVKRMLQHIMKMEVLIGAALVICMVAVMVVEVVMRYIFNNSIIWVQEFVILLFIWITMLGASAALMTRSHITINTFGKYLSGRLRNVMQVIVSLVIIGVLVYLLLTLPASISIQNKTRTSSMPVNIGKGYYYSFPLMVSVIIMMLTQLYYLYYDVKALLGKPCPEDYILEPIQLTKKHDNREATV